VDAILIPKRSMGQVMMLQKFEDLINNYLNWKDEALGKCLETCGALLFVNGHGELMAWVHLKEPMKIFEASWLCPTCSLAWHS
jgi:hypothetical protein